MWLSLLSIPLGLATLAGLFTFADNPPVMEYCSENAKEVFGVRLVDVFICIIVPFFQDLLRNEFGYLIGVNGLAAALSLIFFVLVEGGRKGSRFFVKYPVVLLLLGQVMGIGAAFPLLFIPSFEAGQNKCQGLPYRPVSLLRTVLALIFFLPFSFFVIFLLSLHNHVDSKLFIDLATIFQFSPLFFLPLAPFRPSSSKTPAPPYNPASSYFSTAKFGYALCAGLSLSIYFFSLSRFALAHQLTLPLDSVTSLEDLQAFLSLIPEKLMAIDFMSNGAALGLACDILGFALGTALLSLKELGFLSFLKFLVLSVLLSPGFAMAHFYFEREAKLEILAAKSQILAAKGETKKKN